MAKTNKISRNERNRLMIGGLTKNFKATDSLPVEGVPTLQPAIIAVLQASNDATDNTATAEAAYHKAVTDQDAATTKGDTTYLSLKDYFLLVNKATPQTLMDYGLEPVVRKVPTAATKAAAAATRKANKEAKAAKLAAPATTAPPETTAPTAVPTKS